MCLNLNCSCCAGTKWRVFLMVWETLVYFDTVCCYFACNYFICCFRFLLGVVLFVLGLSAGVRPATFWWPAKRWNFFLNHSVPVETLWPTILKPLQITKSKSDWSLKTLCCEWSFQSVETFEPKGHRGSKTADESCSCPKWPCVDHSTVWRKPRWSAASRNFELKKDSVHLTPQIPVFQGVKCLWRNRVDSCHESHGYYILWSIWCL